MKKLTRHLKGVKKEMTLEEGIYEGDMKGEYTNELIRTLHRKDY